MQERIRSRIIDRLRQVLTLSPPRPQDLIAALEVRGIRLGLAASAREQLEDELDRALAPRSREQLDAVVEEARSSPPSYAESMRFSVQPAIDVSDPDYEPPPPTYQEAMRSGDLT
jgi:hypothetical protein